MKTLNIGILAHVDAGKTSLSERLLFEAGVIKAVGSVDHGTTQTDSLEMERKRGITIKSAVVSFPIGDLDVNIIDTPGHADFIAEVERSLQVLDGVILVISAVEGVQAQTRVLMRILRRLGIPTLIFANKVDRMGASDRVLTTIRERLTPHTVAMNLVHGMGSISAQVTPQSLNDPGFRTELAEILAEGDDAFLTVYLDDPDRLTTQRYRTELAFQVGSGRVCPVFFGSAITGAGMADLIQAIGELFPANGKASEDQLSGVVFKIERGAAGEKIAYIRLYAGSLNVRDRIELHRSRPGRHPTQHGAKVTAIQVFGRGDAESGLCAGGIAKVWGLKDVLIGDHIGTPPHDSDHTHFPLPSLESSVFAEFQIDQHRLYSALQNLAEQDPLMNVRQYDDQQAPVISLYGEVQKEVIKATLAEQFGINVSFGDTRTIYIEKITGVGGAAEVIDKRGHNDFYATVGLSVKPGLPGSGVVYQLGVELGSLPRAFHTAIQESVHQTLRQGLWGWEVTDCVVTLTHSGFAGPISTAWDFRALTPLVLMNAVRKAGTQVHEPINHFELETSADTLSATLARLAEAGAILRQEPIVRAGVCWAEGTIPAGQVKEIERQLPAITQGGGVFMSAFEKYRPVAGLAPVRTRTGANPLDRKEYLVALSIQRSGNGDRKRNSSNPTFS